MKRLLILTLVAFTLTIFAPSAHADVMQTVGDGLKKAGTVAVDLFKKGKDKVMGLFASADPEKIPYLIKKLQESQYALSAKQQGLLELYGSSTSTSGSARPIGDAYMQERANDLQLARKENLEQLEALKKLVSACESKKKDYSQYKPDLSTVEKTQGDLEKNQQILEQKLAKYMSGSSTTGASEENPSGLSEDELAQKFNSADNPYTSAGVGKNSATNEEDEEPSYEPGLSSDKPQAPSSSSKSLDPNSGEVKALIDQWLAMKGLDSYGRLLGNGITASGSADTGGMTRETWLMANMPELRQYVKANMGKGTTSASTAAAVPDTSTSEERPSAGNEVAASNSAPSAPTSSSQSTADANSSSNASREALTSNISSGTGTTDEMTAKYNSYLQADKNRREVLSQQHQATSE